MKDFIKKYWKFILIELLLIGVVIAADLLTKEFIYGKVERDGKIDIIKGVLSFTAVRNTGASFGMFGEHTSILTIVSAVSAFGLLVFLIFSAKNRNILLRSSLVLIIGGAIGNLVDRIALKYVRDFVYVEIIDFAVFNLADSALTVGTILLIIYVLFFYGKDQSQKPQKESQ
ncbi:MAG: signal peptidase II [Bacillota bacterium]|jgi:signal peptidase II|nr:signal peptidase II [Bacillota bacterium]